MGKMGKVATLDPDELLTIRNPVFLTFVFYSAVCLVKMVAMSWITMRRRITSEVFANPEDVKKFAKDQEKKPVLDDVDVERVRRNHLNDLENIVPFVLIGMLYVLVNPNPTLAAWYFRLFAASRLFHTAAYQMPDRFPQPCRVAAFLAGSAINTLMAGHVIAASFSARARS